MKRSIILVSCIIVAIASIASGFYFYKRHYVAACTDDCNILFISVDSLRADHVGAYGYSRNTTPNFDALTQKGTLFKNYYSPSFLTPVSEASVQTGLYPTSHGLKNFDSVLPTDRKILPQYMKSLGFSTQAIMSSPEFEAFKPIKQSFSRGYDSYVFPQKVIKPGEPIRQYPPINTVRDALTKSNNSKQRKFVWLALGGLHWPFGYNEPNAFGVTNYSGPLSGQLLDWVLFKNIYDGKLYPNKINLQQADIQYVRDQYDNGVLAFDNYLGQVMGQLKQLKLDKKTIIIIESEHGEELGEHGYFAHYDVYDTQVHDPLLVVDPRVSGNKKISSMATSVDVLPTVLDLVGAHASSKLQGKSLVPLIKGQEKDGQREEVFLERVPLWEQATLQNKQDLANKGIDLGDSLSQDIGIRTDKYKYILRLAHKKQSEISWWQSMSGLSLNFPEAELYDLKKDPGETKNIIKERPDIASQLNKRLNQWYKKVQQDQPTNIKKTEIVQPYL